MDFKLAHYSFYQKLEPEQKCEPDYRESACRQDIKRHLRTECYPQSILHAIYNQQWSVEIVTTEKSTNIGLLGQDVSLRTVKNDESCIVGIPHYNRI